MAEVRTGPWLEGIVAVPGRPAAEAVRRALRARRIRTRAIPGGAAPGAWNGVDPSGRTVGIVLSGSGPDEARAAAAYWALQARTLLTLGESRGTGLVAAPALVVEGDAALEARARTGLAQTDPRPQAGRLESVSSPPVSDAALCSLADAGIAAVDGQTASWREAAALLGLPFLAVHVLGLEEPATAPAGGSGRDRGESGWGRRARALLSWTMGRGLDATGAPAGALDAGARAAVAAILGPA